MIQRQTSTARRSSAREKHLATSTRSIIQTQITNGHHTGERNKNQTFHILVPYARCVKTQQKRLTTTLPARDRSSFSEPTALPAKSPPLRVRFSDTRLTVLLLLESLPPLTA
jgi:hypothetical protein